ncbi:MAG TPA: hypothetical protein VHM70_32635 [Polyangiaceae bacterium]|nr:hypothetical protein [Polyangiaceae bacterium]
MNTQLLIDQIVRQTTVLIAQLATSGGVRAPLAHVANQVFLELARELEAQGISKKVSADMFGLALRSYRRRIQRLSESQTDRSRSLWEAVLDFTSQGRMVTRQEILKRFFRDEETFVAGVLRDLCESGLVLQTGKGRTAAYRAATRDELIQVNDRDEGVSELLWTFIYREGPLSRSELSQLVGTDRETTDEMLTALIETGRVQESAEGKLRARSVLLLAEAGVGWEAAMFDHYQAVVQTLCQRLSAGDEETLKLSGGSTYRLNVWRGHPLEQEVKGALASFRKLHSDLRERVQRYNTEHGLPDQYEQVTLYGGQSITAQDRDDE